MSADGGPVSGQRLDLWLWYARITKSRTLAQALIEKGKVRVNRDRIIKSAHTLRLGNAVTVSLGPRVRILKVEGFGVRRGPTTEAATLYHELTPETVSIKAKTGNAIVPAGPGNADTPQAFREQGTGRPTKRDRRALVRLKGRMI
jgi:ribosome-associated heat shock protein Hsp15